MAEAVTQRRSPVYPSFTPAQRRSCRHTAHCEELAPLVLPLEAGLCRRQYLELGLTLLPEFIDVALRGSDPFPLSRHAESLAYFGHHAARTTGGRGQKPC